MKYPYAIIRHMFLRKDTPELIHVDRSAEHAFWFKLHDEAFNEAMAANRMKDHESFRLARQRANLCHRRYIESITRK